jgi:excinuclease ABC subunit A
MSEFIEVIGARSHNLKNIDIQIPKNKLVVITGISGSGKSSLAFDTIYNEGQRRYMETFGAYARQFIGDMERPDVDKISGLSPVISIEQKTTNRNPRSTVGTVTEIYDFLRLLYARASDAYSYNTGKKMVKFSEEEIVDNIFEKFTGENLLLLAPLVRGRKGHYRELFEEWRKKGFLKMRIDGTVVELTEKMQLDRYKIHDIDLVVDRLPVTTNMRTRISAAVQQALKLGKDLMYVQTFDENTKQPKQGKLKFVPSQATFSRLLMCSDTGISYEEPNPNTFSFNSPYGACPNCKGLGSVYTVNMEAVMPDATKSITEGGIIPLGEKRDAWVFRQAEALAKKHKIKLDTPINKLPQAFLDKLLFGGTPSNNIQVEASFDVYIPEVDESTTGFEGIVKMVVRWFNKSSSESIRSWAEEFMQLSSCPTCNETRLKKESIWFKINEKNIAELSNMDLNALLDWFSNIEKKLSNKQNAIAKDVLKEIRERIQFLLDVGLHYLNLNRPTRTLSGGESQRIRLATQIGSQLQGITYILDEPSIGLHQRDNARLIKALQNLRNLGNTVIVVEHDKDIMLAADYIIDIGPKAGIHGGKIVAALTPKQMLKQHTITANYLNGTDKIEIPSSRRKGNGNNLKLTGAAGHNLKNVTLNIPLGQFVCVTGVSGSGKSTLINETLYPILSKHCYNSKLKAMPYKKIEGLEHVDKVIEIDQSPIGRTPRSNPATYCGFFTDIRTLFASIPEAKIRGYNAGRFSFNVKTGRCEVCEGSGMRTIEMNFLPDVYVPCEKCRGQRFNTETLEIRYKGKSISDVLNMTVEEACEFFISVPYIYRKIKVLDEVGLGYITLGQSAVTLSGGEAQRVKLSTELSKRDTGKTFYILDEPTTGLHFEDIKHLLEVLNKLVDRGNTVLVIEHNLDIVKVADYVIDIGLEGGAGGGSIIAEGKPELIIKQKTSHTAKYLALELQ